MRAPEFWQSRNLTAACLLPLSVLFLLAGRLARWSATPKQVNVPVLCIGNATVGGTGKTPVALAIHDLVRPPAHFLSRGYGGKLRDEPHRVQPSDTAAEVGDEPLLLARAAPCWVCPDRAASAEAAIAAGAELLIMDDGLQNPSLAKTLSLLVVDGAQGFGNGWILPAGPLREPLGHAFARVQGIILVGENRAGATFPHHLPVFTGRIVAIAPLTELSQPVLAFAGIGHPQKFFSMLEEGGVTPAAAQAFPDHHAYTAADREALREEASHLGAHLTTTAKDAVKWPEGERAALQIVEVAFRFDDEAAFLEFLEEHVAPAS